MDGWIEGRPAKKKTWGQRQSPEKKSKKTVMPGGWRGSRKSAKAVTRRTETGTGSVDGTRVACNGSPARFGDGCRWFARAPGDFRDARALPGSLMMGSGEDSTDKIERDGGCGHPMHNRSTFQHSIGAGRVPHLLPAGN